MLWVWEGGGREKGIDKELTYRFKYFKKRHRGKQEKGVVNKEQK